MFRLRRRRHIEEEAESDGRDFDRLGDPTDGYTFRGDADDNGLDRPAWDSIAERDGDDTSVLTAPISGPFDSSIAPRDELTRVDVGALRVPVLPGVNIHPQLEDNHISALVLVNGGSALQIIPFAAPADDSAWTDIRHDLRMKLEAENYSPRDCEGEFDVELLANLPSQNGRQLVRFLGIDGPRWFLRGMFTGAAASDPAAGQTLIKVLANMVVVRGNEPRPVRDPLPMHLPKKSGPPARKQTLEQPQARVSQQLALRDRGLAEESLPGSEQAPSRSPYLAGATYRERFGPVADETIEIRGLPFVDDDELALSRQ